MREGGREGGSEGGRVWVGECVGGSAGDRDGWGWYTHACVYVAQECSICLYQLAPPDVHCTSFLLSLFALLPCRADARSSTR